MMAPHPPGFAPGGCKFIATVGRRWRCLFPSGYKRSTRADASRAEHASSKYRSMALGNQSWQDPEAGAFGSHDFADFAQEFLRRNPAYRQAVASAQGQVDLIQSSTHEALANPWGLCCFFDPDASPRGKPALWRPACHPAILEIRCSTDSAPALLPQGYGPLAEFKSGNAHHLVLAMAAYRLRLCLWQAPGQQSPAMILLKDKSLAVRLAAAGHYARICKEQMAPLRPPCQPSPYQRRSLVRLLQIDDAMAAGATCRDIASTIVFPNHECLSGMAWKGSAERRHCWRLIGQARRLQHGGHLRLLALARSVGKG